MDEFAEARLGLEQCGLVSASRPAATTEVDLRGIHLVRPFTDCRLRRLAPAFRLVVIAHLEQEDGLPLDHRNYAVLAVDSKEAEACITLPSDLLGQIPDW